MLGRILKYINYSIETLLCFMVFLVPLYFSWFYHSSPLFSLDKIFLFQILVEIIILLSFVKIFLEKKIKIFILKRAFIFFVLFIIIFFVITFLLSNDLHVSFWGSYFRQLGMFAYLHYFFFALILFFNIKGKRQIERIVNSILVGSFFVSFYGILQWLGIEFFSWQEKLHNPVFGRAISTLGQPVFLGNYLVLTIFLSVYKIISAPKFLSKFLFFLIFCSQFFCLIVTYTRGAWLGFAAGMMLGFFIYFASKTKNIWKSAVASFLFLIIVIIGTLGFLKISPNNFLTKRIRSITDFQSGSLAMRLETWKSSLAIISQSSWTGYGLESARHEFVKYYNPLWSIYERINTSPDKAHNIIFDILLEGGVIMFFAWLVWLFYVFKTALSVFFQKQDYLALFLFLSLFSYLFSLFFSFHTAESLLFFWLYIALILILANNFESDELFNFKRARSFIFLIFVTLEIGLSVLCFFLIGINVNNLKSDYFFRQARFSYLHNDYQKMYDYYIKSINLNNRQEYYRWFFVNDSLNTLEKINSPAYRASLISYLENINQLDQGKKDNFGRILKQANFYKILGKFKDKKYYKTADESYLKLISLSPLMPDSYKGWAESFVYRGDYKKAILVYEMALGVLPNPGLPNYPLHHKWELEAFMANVKKGLNYCYYKLDI